MISERTYPAGARPVERGLTVNLYRSWDRIGLGAILILAAVLNIYGLSKEGYGNTYYAAAVRSMMQNWHAFFFNSLDPAGFVTIDKPPLGFWLQVASAKIFGFNGVALMLPQALAGVGSVALLYYLVSRPFGKPAGLLAALALAVTPISVVSNRNNIVDSTLVFALLLGAWALTRAVDTGKLRWLLLCALFVGLGFNIKMLEAYLVVPAFGLMYLLGARVGWGRRLIHLALATALLLVVSLSWVMAVDLTPASQRPWVGSTTTNSALDLAIGYNGLQRLTGNSGVGGRQPFGSNAPRSTGRGATASGTGRSASTSAAPQGGNAGPGGGNGGGPGGVGENGPIGPLRLLDAQLGGQISWLLPLAVIGFFVGAWYTRRRPIMGPKVGPTPRPKVGPTPGPKVGPALGPQVGPTLGLKVGPTLGPKVGWPLDARQSALVMWGAWLLTTGVFFSVAGFYHTYYLVMMGPPVAALAATGAVTLWRMYRQPGGRLSFLLPLGLLAAAAVQVHILADYPAWSRWMTPLIVGLTLLVALVLAFMRFRPHLTARLALPALLLGLAALLTGPATWSVQSVNAASSGILPRAGPAGSTGTAGFGGFGPPGKGGTFHPPNGAFGPPPGGANGNSGAPGSFKPPAGVFPPAGGNFRPPNGGGPGGPGGDQVNKALLTFLEKHQGTATYLFATTGAGTAEPYIIATGKAVMAMGGFTGSDPILNATKVAALVKQGAVRYFLLGGGGPGGGFGGGDTSATSWVQANCTLVPASKYSSTKSTTSGFGDGSLYDCGAVK